MHRFHRKV